MTNEDWKKAYKEGFSDGYAAAKKELNYQNFPPVYYGGVGVRTNDPHAPVLGTPTTAGGFVSSPVSGVPTGGLNTKDPRSYAINGGFTVNNTGEDLYNGC